MLRVENTGEHLPPGLVPMLAEPFRRGSRARTDDHAGVGLGLAILCAHGGALDLTPRPEGGLRITIRLPSG